MKIQIFQFGIHNLNAKFFFIEMFINAQKNCLPNWKFQSNAFGHSMKQSHIYKPMKVHRYVCMWKDLIGLVISLFRIMYTGKILNKWYNDKAVPAWTNKVTIKCYKLMNLFMNKKNKTHQRNNTLWRIPTKLRCYNNCYCATIEFWHKTF